MFVRSSNQLQLQHLRSPHKRLIHSWANTRWSLMQIQMCPHHHRDQGCDLSLSSFSIINEETCTFTQHSLTYSTRVLNILHSRPVDGITLSQPHVRPHQKKHLRKVWGKEVNLEFNDLIWSFQRFLLIYFVCFIDAFYYIYKNTSCQTLSGIVLDFSLDFHQCPQCLHQPVHQPLWKQSACLFSVWLEDILENKN